MTVRIAVSGAAGRMGRNVTRLVIEDPELELVAALERPDHPEVGRDAGAVAGTGSECGVKLAAEFDGEVDCFIVYSAPEGTINCLRDAVAKKAALVAGTTGLSAEQEEEFAAAANSSSMIRANCSSTGPEGLTFAMTIFSGTCSTAADPSRSSSFGVA